MVFSSPGFLFIFFPLFFLLYFCTPKTLRNALVLVASLGFYLLGAGALTLVALVLITINWALAFYIGRRRHAPVREVSEGTMTRMILIGGIALNLGPLVFYKYLGFLNKMMTDLVGMPSPLLSGEAGIILPLGISFYTFHFISYLVDVYARRIHPEGNLGKFVIYIFLFPHLVAGPIVRFAEIKAQLALKRRALVESDVFWGLALFTIGLSKKLLIADPLGEVVDTVHRHDVQLSTYSAWLAAFCYSFQIYFDFSGYTDMAIGMARVMGFRFPRNFDRPYAASSITEFWRRWHMTLSRWFRDYLYIPLGGNRMSPFVTYRNLFIVFGLCGLWHGAAYTFLAWGLAHGFLLVLERARILRLNALPFGSVIVFLFVTMLWVPFRAEDLSTLNRFTSVMLAMDTGLPLWTEANRMLADSKVIFLLALSAAICLCGDRLFNRLRRFSFRNPMLTGVYCLALYILSCISVVERGFNPFIYFQF